METLAAVIARGRDRDGTAVLAPDRAVEFSYREFSTNVWKAGNLLRHYGVRPGADLAVVAGPKEPGPAAAVGRLGRSADPLLALLGGLVVGATVDLTPDSPVEARALVAPDAWLDRYETAPGCSRLAYGGPPETAGVAHFERELWSENPVEPPGDPGVAAVLIDGRRHAVADLLASAAETVERFDLGAGDRVLLDAPLTQIEAVTAGVLAPLSVGATVCLGRTDEDGSANRAYEVSGEAATVRSVTG